MRLSLKLAWAAETLSPKIKEKRHKVRGKPGISAFCLNPSPLLALLCTGVSYLASGQTQPLFPTEDNAQSDWDILLTAVFSVLFQTTLKVFLRSLS